MLQRRIKVEWVSFHNACTLLLMMMPLPYPVAWGALDSTGIPLSVCTEVTLTLVEPSFRVSLHNTKQLASLISQLGTSVIRNFCYPCVRLSCLPPNMHTYHTRFLFYHFRCVVLIWKAELQSDCSSHWCILLLTVRVWAPCQLSWMSGRGPRSWAISCSFQGV